MGLSTVAPAMADPPSGEHPACEALEKAKGNAGNDKAKAAIQKNLDKHGCNGNGDNDG